MTLRLLCALALLICSWLTGAAAAAGTLSRAQLEQMFPPPMMVGEKLAHVPAWPIFRRNGNAPELQNFAFETVDLEPVSGYGGKPLNLLVVTDRSGVIVQTLLLSHAEPIFRSDAGNAILSEFAAQYQGVTVNHQVQILGAKAARQLTPTVATLHGIVAGTVTARAIDRSIMEAAKNRLLLNIWQSLQIETRTTITMLTEGLDLVEIADSHQPIIDAIASGDAERAARVAREHQDYFERLPVPLREEAEAFPSLSA